MTQRQTVFATLLVFAPAALLWVSALACLQGSCSGDATVHAADKTQSRLRLTVRDADTKQLIPALVNFHTATGEPVTFGNFADLPGWSQGASAVELGKGGEAMFAFRHGLALWKGEGTFIAGKPWEHRDVNGTAKTVSQVVPGLYKITVSRGVEYDAVELQADLSAGGDVAFDVELKRTVDSAGYLSADVHTHAAPDSPDAFTTGGSQLKVAAVNGLDVIVGANHDTLADLGAVVASLWPKGTAPLVTVIGEEKSGTNSHWGLFPIVRDAAKPGKGAPVVRPWPLPQFFQDLRTIPGRPIVVLNHPRLGWQAYFDEGFCGAWAKRDFSAPPPCPQDFDATELLNGWQSCGTRMRDATETWLALASYNFTSAAVGGSDSHYTAAMVPGYPRTWINVGDDNLKRFSAGLLVQAIRARHTSASNAPLVTLRSGAFVEGDFMMNAPQTLPLAIRVQGANWVTVDTVRLLVNGTVAKTWTIPRNGGAVDFRIDESLALGDEDAFVTVETDSQLPLPPLIVGEYNAIIQYGSPKCPPRAGQEPGLPAFAVTSPLFLDRDNDGLFRGNRATAGRKL
ncbi:MAG: CehA/McbA family metallohydrolase [Deltaproteobacteria bacterium]|nr:CehA/McbA family metallohydrolase [Deltaproteobacteria bacterium]